MNFREFEKLINSGAKEITLTEDVIIDIGDEDLFKEGMTIENDLSIIGNGHLISFKNMKSPYFLNVASNLVLENCSLMNVIVVAKGADLKFKNCNFKSDCIDYGKYSIYLENDSSLDLEGCISCGIDAADSNLSAVDSNMGFLRAKNGEISLKKSKIITIENDSALIDLDECDFIGENILAPIYNKKGTVNANNCNFEYIKSDFSKRKDEDKNIHNEEVGYMYSYRATDTFILNEKGFVEINDSTFKNNDSKFYRDGGAIYNDSGSMILRNCLFEDNYSDLRGGAIYNNGSLTAESCRFNNNDSKFGGKCIHNLGNILIDSCEFLSDEENMIVNEKGHITVRNSKLDSHHLILVKDDVDVSNEDNNYNFKYFKDSDYLQELLDCDLEEIKLDYDILGGGIRLERDNLVIDGCGNAISGNDEDAIFDVYGDNITLKNFTFKNGLRKYHDGGAIFNHGKTLNIENCIFENNRAANYGGGAIYNGKGSLNIKNSMFKDNIAPYNRSGGAIYNYDGIINIENSIFLNNLAADAGGAIYNIGALNINSCKFIKNKVKYIGQSMLDFIGGGIYNQKGKVNIQNTEFEDNEAYSGNAIYNNDTTDIRDSSFKGDDNYMIVNDAMLSLRNISLGNNHNIYNKALLSISDGEKNRYLNNIDNVGMFFKIIENNMKVNEKSFTYLDSLINSDSEEVSLDYDISLAPDEEKNYKNGIKINNKKLIIRGNGHYIDARGKSSIFDIMGGEVLIEDVVCKNALSKWGTIESLKSDIKINNCIFENNYSVGSGLIHSKDSKIKLINSKFFDNFSPNGAVAHSLNSILKIFDCDFKYNRSPNGGIFYTERSRLFIKNSRFSSNYNVFRSNYSDYNVELSDFENNENSQFEGFRNKIGINGCNFKNNCLYSSAIGNHLGFVSLSKCNFRFDNSKSKTSEIVTENLLVSNCLFELNTGIVAHTLIIDVNEFEKIKEIVSTNEMINIQDIVLDTSKEELSLSEDRMIDDLRISKDFILEGKGYEIKGLFNNEICTEADNVLFKNIVFSKDIKIVNKKSLVIENCKFLDNHINRIIENHGELLLKDCCFEKQYDTDDIILNKAKLTLKNCNFDEKHMILNSCEVTLVTDDGKEVLTDEIIKPSRDDDEGKSISGLGALFG